MACRDAKSAGIAKRVAARVARILAAVVARNVAAAVSSEKAAVTGTKMAVVIARRESGCRARIMSSVIARRDATKQSPRLLAVGLPRFARDNRTIVMNRCFAREAAAAGAGRNLIGAA